MNIQFDARLTSSFLMFLENWVLKQGQAYTNHSSLFYPISGNQNGLYTYSAPFRSFVSDIDVTGANVMTGVYLGGNFITIGQSGLQKINYPKGLVQFTGQIPSNVPISGNYAVSEFNIELTDQSEYKLLFETKYVTNSKFQQNLTGLDAQTKTTPAIFVKVQNSENKPFAFSRIDNNQFLVRLVAICESEFQKISLCNVLKNLNMKEFKVISGNMPLDYMGSYTGSGISYNYANLPIASGYFPLVWGSKIINIPLRGEYANISRNTAMCDLTVETIMRHP